LAGGTDAARVTVGVRHHGRPLDLERLPEAVAGLVRGCALPATTAGSERVSFHTLHRATGHRVKRQFVDAETGDVVEPEDQVKGYEIGKGEHLIVEDDELAAIRIESSHTIDIDSFVPQADVDERYLETPYYLAPADRVAQEAFAIIREAMRKKGVVGIARVVLQKRERILKLAPFEKGLLATTLRYATQVRNAGAIFEDIADTELQNDMLDLAAHIIEPKTGTLDVSRYEDRYENALIDLVEAKQGGREVQPVETPQPSNVINLMDALRRSVASEKASTAKSRTPEAQRTGIGDTPPKRRAAAATAKDQTRKSPRPKKAR
jgi:DNA end-binding protein Ku